MKHGRPYPRDSERRIRVKIELARRNMSIADLGRALGMKRQLASAVINGVRRSPKTEEKIAAYFSLPREMLFKAREAT
jgi:transcriptional regulator with XRE-family HTH domain